MKNKQFSKSNLVSIAVLLAICIILFEFILPVNKMLPKPSLLLESFSSLRSDYNLLEAFIVSASVVYVAIFVGYLLVSLLAVYLTDMLNSNNNFLSSLKIFRYFPAFFYAIIFAYWFPGSIIAEYFFALIAAIFFIVLTIKIELPNVKQEYIFSAKSLGIPASKINWKCIQPEVFESLSRLHYYLWVLVLVFEFIGQAAGFGGIYYSLLRYNDFAALFALAIVISIIVLLGSLFIEFFKSKIIFWQQ